MIVRLSSLLHRGLLCRGPVAESVFVGQGWEATEKSSTSSFLQWELPVSRRLEVKTEAVVEGEDEENKEDSNPKFDLRKQISALQDRFPWGRVYLERFEYLWSLLAPNGAAATTVDAISKLQVAPAPAPSELSCTSSTHLISLFAVVESKDAKRSSRIDPAIAAVDVQADVANCLKKYSTLVSKDRPVQL